MPPRSAAASPWAVALGTSTAELHPRVRRYLEGVPAGGLGRGSGVFEVVGTPRWWLWPVLAVLARQGVLAPAWEHDVPFVVINRLGSDGALRAERRFALPDRPWTMVDAVLRTGEGLVDDLGDAGRYRARLRAWVDGGALRLRSTGVSVRLGRLRVPLPTLVAPVLDLREGFDDAAGRQRVHLRLTHPLIGLLYEYRGTFEYRVEEEPR